MDRVTQYSVDVLSGDIIAGESVKLACKRHLDDMEKSKLAPYRYRFDIDKANAIIDYAETLVLAEGDEVIELTLFPFQAFILGSLLGWVDKETGYRRFRQSYIQMARQQGKSLLSGVLTTYYGNFVKYNYGLILLCATKLDQAKIVYKEAVKFINSDNDLQELFTVKEYKSEIECKMTNNLIRAIGRDSKSIDGFRAIYGSADELHAHENGDIYNLIKDGQKKLKEALLNSITTAGFNIDGFCHKLYKYCKQILEGTESNETQFIYISELDDDDDLDDINNWYKANPTLQYDTSGIALDTLKNDYAQAKAMGGKDWNNYLTKNLNKWCEFTETKYMNMTAFYKCACDMTLEDFRGQDFILGLDASSGGDLTSISFEFTFLKGEEKKYFIHHHSFIPAMRVAEHEQTDNSPYAYWIKKKLITSTTALGGIKTDYKEILKYVKDMMRKYDLKLKMICYDQANVSAFLVDLEEFGVDCFDIYQTSKSLNDAVMDIKYEVEAGNIYFNKDDELLIWAVNNAQITTPLHGKIMLDKNSRFKRIDPVASWVDAHKFSMRNEAKPRILTADSIKSFYS